MQTLSDSLSIISRWAPKHTKQILIELKGEISSNIITVEVLNRLLLITERSSGRKSIRTSELERHYKRRDQTDTYRTFHSTPCNTHSFKCTQSLFWDISCETVRRQFQSWEKISPNIYFIRVNFQNT